MIFKMELPPLLKNTLLDFWNKIKESLFRVPLQFKIIGLAVGLVALFGTVTIVKVHAILVSNMKLLLKEESLSVARELASHSKEYILINDLYGLTRLLKDIHDSRPEVRYAYVVDSYHEVLSHTFSGGFPGDLLRNENHVGLNERTVSLLTNEGVIWDTFYPALGENGGGGVHVGITEAVMQHQITALLRSLLMHTVIIMVIALILSVLLTLVITKPVKKLLGATRAIRNGSYESIVGTSSQDEVGELVVAFNAMLQQLQQADVDRREKEKLRKEFLQRIISTQEQERKRVARELHDQTGQALASIMVRLDVLDKSYKSGLSEDITALKKSLIEEMGAIHDLARELRPSILDDMGLVPGLELYFNQFRERHDLVVEFVEIGMRRERADPGVETCVYRIIQESLTNIIKHAEADAVRVLLEWRQEKIRCIIEDNGKGFDLEHIPKDRLGLYGMEERAHLLGGVLKVDSEFGEGTMISFTIPAKSKVKRHD